jgi:hypothetical protein
MLGGYPPRRNNSFFLLALYFIFAAYFINYAIKFIPIPTAIDPFNKWIVLVGGALLIIAAFNQIRLSSRYSY